MTCPTPDIVDLRNELLFLKKQFGDSKSENLILKVKIRRMQEDLLRKNKDLQILLDPQKAMNRRVMAEQGNSLILKLREQIEDLKTQLQMRDFQIKKLHTQLIATKVYDKNTFFLKNFCDNVRPYRCQNSTTKNNVDDCVSASPIDKFSCALNNLQKNISTIKENCDVQYDNKIYNMEGGQVKTCSPNVKCVQKKLVHEDLEDLTSYVMQMTLDLDNLKTNFMQLQRNKFNKSKTAEPKPGSKAFSPKVIQVQPKVSIDSKSSNAEETSEVTTTKVINQLKQKSVVKSAFMGRNSKTQSVSKTSNFCQMSDCGVCNYEEDTDSVSEIIILDE